MHTLVLGGYHLQFHQWISHLVVPNLRLLRVGQQLNWEYYAASSATRDGYMSVDIDTSHFNSASFDQLLLVLLSLPHTLCPALTDIAIFGASAVVCDAAALAFVKTRMAIPSPLQQFRVGFGHAMELDIMPELQSFISGSGLQVDIKYSLPDLR
ncbi:hypothetical protein B0H14DRAFT_2584686 [Mycena olivaceomarginata]|nr:hypothetical protein B0H14DRAFT_2584686 [Mycena olivaceomarginata]